MPTSVRIDEETEGLLERAAQLKAVSKSTLIRTALRQFCLRITPDHLPTPYESIKDLIGCVKGPPDLSRNMRHYMRDFGRGKKTRRAR